VKSAPTSAGDNDPAEASVTVGCDVGGTYTDLILLDPGRGGLRLAKVPTSTPNQADGVLAALRETGLPPAEIGLFIHGTTATTNAVLERKLARCGLITTRGFRDVLELGRRTRPRPYGLIGSFDPVIPRELRVEVTERMTATGEIYRALDEEEVASAARALLSAGAEAVVIHFIHSYANPAHELHAADIVRTFWPNQYVTVGHKVIAEYREYERGVTAAVNGAVQPVLHRYIERLEHELSERGYQRGLLIMRGNGGTASSKVVTKTAVHTVMSGPASGVIAAAHIALAAGHRNVVTYDMGGTSTDVALVQNGIPLVSSELELEYAMPIHVPMVDVHTVGAGGGSIAHVNEAGLLQIGPESAGAIPVPICFGRGGVRPTITDANLVLGRLNKDRLLGVKAGMDLADVTRAIDDKIGRVLDLDVEAAAAAILRVANDKMAGAIRLVSLARGHDPRDFALLAFGGAGPLHATALARELGIPDVLIPARPGLTNAFGCLVADLRHDFVRTVNKPLWTLKRADLRAILDDHVAEGRRVIGQEAVALSDISILHAADMQFEGQTHILNVAIRDGSANLDSLEQAFAEAYWQRFRVALPEIKPVLVNLHTAVIGRRDHISIRSLADGDRARTVGAARVSSRGAWFDKGWLDTPVYERDRLPLESEFRGPAILEQLDATTIIEPDDYAHVDAFGNVLIKVA
jgi:N-methylhydantoinase A